MAQQDITPGDAYSEPKRSTDRCINPDCVGGYVASNALESFEPPIRCSVCNLDNK